MTIASLKWSQKARATREVLASNEVRTLIANQLGVDVKRVRDEAHFTDDLGADWLDRLELMIVIEDRFADVVITDFVGARRPNSRLILSFTRTTRP
jgi:acyl carrier protein